MTNRIEGCHFRPMPLLILAGSGSAFVREPLAAVNHLLAALPPVRLKAMLRPGARASSARTSKLPDCSAGNQIADEYQCSQGMQDVEIANNGGVK